MKTSRLAMWKRYPTKVARIKVSAGHIFVRTRACAGGLGLGPRFILSCSAHLGGRFRRLEFDMGEADVKDMAKRQGELFSAFHTALDAHLQDEAKRWLKALRASRRKS